MQQEKKLEILKKHYREYYKDTFPADRLDSVVKQALCIKEETEAIMKAMEEYAATQHSGTPGWVKCSAQKPNVYKLTFKDKHGNIFKGNYSKQTGQYYAYGFPNAIWDVIEWLGESESPSKEGNNTSNPTFWDVAEAFKWAAEYRDEIGGQLTLYNDRWTVISEDEDGNENETQDLTPGNVAELYCLQKGFEKKEGNKEREDWISVNDRLPELETKVIVLRPNEYSKKNDVLMAYLHDSGEVGRSHGRLGESKWLYGHYWSLPAIVEFKTITHWLPLPVAPQYNQQKEGMK